MRSVNRKLRLNVFSEDRPSWIAIGLGGFIALVAIGGLRRSLEVSLGRFWAVGLAALIVLLVYFAFIIRLVGAPWRVVARLALLYALPMAGAFALLSLAF